MTASPSKPNRRAPAARRTLPALSLAASLAGSILIAAPAHAAETAPAGQGRQTPPARAHAIAPATSPGGAPVSAPVQPAAPVPAAAPVQPAAPVPASAATTVPAPKGPDAVAMAPARAPNEPAIALPPRPVVREARAVPGGATSPAVGAAATAAAREASADPMESLRDRLAARLGRLPAPVAPGVLQVASRGAADTGSPSAATPRARARPPAAPGRALTGQEATPGHDAVTWHYHGAGGPDAWSQLRPEFATCSQGSRQSPIDLHGGIKVQLEPVLFDYRPGPFRIIDNGQTVQVNVSGGSSIDVMGRRYELQQFHFHRPSEERIDGRHAEMSVHLVHKDLEGRLAVVGVMLERGAAQSVIQTVWNHLPLEKHQETAVRTVIDPATLLPAERRYYTYMGSITTPPCSEGVLWMVMKTPVTVSAEQIGIFARLYPMNARPIQSVAGRLIKESE